MKNRLWLLLAVLVFTVSLLATTAFAADPLTAKCEFCGESVTWTPVTTNSQKLTDGHYYMASSLVMTNQSVSGTVHLNLNSKRYTANKVITVADGGELCIQNGALVGRPYHTNNKAAVSFAVIKEGGTLKLDNTTMTFEYSAPERIVPDYGYFQVEGSLYMKDTVIRDGQAAVKGGNITILPTGKVTVENGSIAGGTAPTAPSVYNGGKLILKGSSEIDNILMETLETDRLTLSADFTGSAQLTLPTTVVTGDVVAALETGAATDNITCSNTGVTLEVSGTQLTVNTGYAAAIGNTKYATLTEALDNLTEGQTLQLLSYTPELTLDKAVTLDLNGCSVGTLNAEAAVTVKDSATDDYTVADGIYGTIATVNGTVTPVTGYLQATEESGISFHAYKMEIAGMTLRATEAGIYFTTEFKGDSLAASLVDTFGVAMSVYGEPNESTLEKKGNFTSFDGTLFNGDTDVTSSVVCNVISREYGANPNKRNADMQIYGRPYIKYKDGTVEMGETRNRSFKEQVLQINDYQSDLSWLNDTQKTELLAMYETFCDLLDSWNVTTIADGFQAEEDKTLKVLAITSSFGLNTTQLLADIAMAEGVENIIVARIYASGCSLEQHVNYSQNNLPAYQYTKCVNGEWTTTEGATMLQGILDEYWDIIFLQQSAARSPLVETYQDYVSTVKNYVDLHKRNPNAKYIWNMTWAYQGDSDQSVFVNTFQGDQMAMYNSILNAVQIKILPRTDFAAIIPSGTAIQNARTSYFGDTLTKDTYHLNNLGRAIAGYTLYATIMGLEQPGFRLNDIKLDKAGGWELPNKITLSDSDKLVIMESVNNALDTPFQVTASQYPAK